MSLIVMTEELIKFNEIFLPEFYTKTRKMAEGGQRFAYYTTADTALKILKNKELWLRHSTVVNDFSEISYGIELIRKTFSEEFSKNFISTVNAVFPGTIEKVEQLLNAWVPDCKLETYLACISLHHETEDKSGRLSMWRAYGDTAIVIKNTPLVEATAKLGVFSMPVMYWSDAQYRDELFKVTKMINRNQSYLRELGQDTLVSYIHHMFFHIAIGTKHPGFAEEKEWRIYFRPNEVKAPLIKPEVVVLRGVPQIIYKLPLKNDPESDLHQADIPSLLDRIIIGPTQYPHVSVSAFQQVLGELGVKDKKDKVIASDIPLRSK